MAPAREASVFGIARVHRSSLTYLRSVRARQGVPDRGGDRLRDLERILVLPTPNNPPTVLCQASVCALIARHVRGHLG